MTEFYIFNINIALARVATIKKTTVTISNIRVQNRLTRLSDRMVRLKESEDIHLPYVFMITDMIFNRFLNNKTDKPLSNWELDVSDIPKIS